MGKNKTKSDVSKAKKHERSEDLVGSSPSDKMKKNSKAQQTKDKLTSVIKSVGLPKTADGLTADQLTENQKHALKKVCAQMYGHRHTEKRSLPASSLESATAQLAEKMKEKLAQRKKEKKNKIANNTA